VNIFTVSEVGSELKPSESVKAGELLLTTSVTPVKNSTGSLIVSFRIIDILRFLPYSSQSYMLSNDASRLEFNVIFHE
jgi:hypothetical protein